MSTAQPGIFVLIDSEILGGPGRGLLLFLKHVRANELRYTLVNFDRPHRKSSEFIDAVRAAGHELHLLHEQFRFDPLTIPQAFAIFRRSGANIVQSHGYKSHLLALLISRYFGVPWVSFSHGWTAEDRKIRIYNVIERRLIVRADYSLVVSPLLQQTISALRGEKPTLLILNAVDPEEIPGEENGPDIRRRYGWNEAHLIFGCFGRLSHEKGQDILLDAFASFVAECPMARLLLVGDGVMRESLMARAAALHLEDKVVFSGHQGAIRGFYKSIDLLVLPSRSEGLPNVMLEAMALGVPVLATGVGAIPNVISHGSTGWIVPPNDAGALKEALVEICARPEHRREVAAHAEKEVNQYYSPRRRADVLLALYRRILRQQRVLVS